MMLKAILAWLVLALAALGASGCVSGAPAGEIIRADDGDLAALDTVQAAGYRLGAGDALKITVFGEEALSGEYLVGEQGKVSFPLVGEVDAAGKILPEFTAHLESRLREGYVRAPRVTVEVTNYRPFFILGEVGSPGTYPFSANLTVINAVATAGGFTYRADTRRVFIKHVGEPTEREYRLTSQTPVQPGDTVRIGQRRF